ncbi:Uncharacterized protein GBIM_10699 [Gryllus bimaculatus]|nr:Uncharacterized protein GBIM_10699 [Gryllus bimaculatus]
MVKCVMYSAFLWFGVLMCGIWCFVVFAGVIRQTGTDGCEVMYGAPVSLPEKMSETVKSVMDDMQINQEDRDLLQPFTVYGFDMFHAGSTYTKFGAIVGIPSNFYYSKVEDVDIQNITVQNQPVNWFSSCGESFKESLILSEEAKKFLIAREIASVHSPSIFFKTIFPLTTGVIVSALAHQFNKKLKLLERPPRLGGLLYVIFSFFGLGLWVFLHDFTTIQIELEADKIASSLGEEYVKGGLEAYSKLLERNICLRELMGSKGEKSYTATGNDVYFIRQKHLPISHRKAYMENINKPLKQEKSETVDCKVKSSA